MAINKVVYGNQTLVDLTNDTVSSDKLLSGETAHDRSGNQISGSVVVQNYTEGDGIDISANNEISVDTTFTEASTRTNISSGDTLATIWGKIKKFFSDLKTVAFTGSYTDLTDQPTIPTVNNGTLTIQKNGTNVQTFTANQSTNATANITVPTKTSEITNDSGFKTSGNTINVTRGASVSTATTNYWASMCNSTQAGSPTLPTAGKWWHVLSMDWAGADTKNWFSQLAIATQDGDGVWWRKNNASGTEIDSSTWNRLAEGDSSGNALYANDSAKLGGASASESATASTIVKRNVSGYIYAVYYNASNGAENINSYSTATVVFKDANGWQRCTSKANFQTWLGLASYLPLTGGNMSGKIYTSAARLLQWTTSDSDNNPDGTSWYGLGRFRVSGESGDRVCLSNYWGLSLRASVAGNIRANGYEILTTNTGLAKSGGTMTGNIQFASGGVLFYGTGAASSATAFVKGSGYLNLCSPGIQCRNWADNGWAGITGTSFTPQNNSSRKIKENIKPITEEEAKKLLDVNVVSFDYKKGAGFGDGDERKGKFGVIAEEINEVIPSVVSYQINEDHTIDYSIPSGVSYDKFVPHLIKLVQMQQKEIDELKALVNVLMLKI